MTRSEFHGLNSAGEEFKFKAPGEWVTCPLCMGDGKIGHKDCGHCVLQGQIFAPASWWLSEHPTECRAYYAWRKKDRAAEIRENAITRGRSRKGHDKPLKNVAF